MKTKPEIKEKLEQAENVHAQSEGGEELVLTGVVKALKWVLDVKTTQEPKDPVNEA